MGITEYNVNHLISRSRMRLNYKEILKKDVVFGSLLITVSLLISMIAMHAVPSMTFFLGMFGLLGLKTTIQIMVPTVLKYRANRQLREVVEKLKEYGVNTNRARLIRAKLSTNKTRYKEENGVLLEREQIAVFQDCQGKLKALRQVRSQLIEMQQEKTLSELNCIYPAYSEVISDSSKVRQFVFTK